MKVNGISPALHIVNDDIMMHINTIPEAPTIPVGKNSAFKIPVMNAVAKIIPISDKLPYFSSNRGINSSR